MLSFVMLESRLRAVGCPSTSLTSTDPRRLASLLEDARAETVLETVIIYGGRLVTKVFRRNSVCVLRPILSGSLQWHL